jgi:FKBP-type peptidyl-prolyl cis-trans isomerase
VLGKKCYFLLNDQYMKKRVGIFYSMLLVFLLSAVFTSCKKEEGFTAEDEQRMIQAFLKDNELDVEPTESGLYYIEQIEGPGNSPVTGDTVDVYYTGYYLTGGILDHNRNSDPLRVVIGEHGVIEGMEEGLTYIKEGGEALLIIPSKLAYGEEGNYQMGIAPYTPLAFVVEIDKLIPGPGK